MKPMPVIKPCTMRAGCLGAVGEHARGQQHVAAARDRHEREGAQPGAARVLLPVPRDGQREQRKRRRPSAGSPRSATSP